MNRLNIEEGIIKRAVADELDKIISESDILLEYAINRKAFKEMVEARYQQIFENWVLIRYCNLIGRTRTVHHWETELMAYVDKIKQAQIKENNSVKMRYKVISAAFDSINVDRSQRLLRQKLVKEEINPDDANVRQAVSNFYTEIEAIKNNLAETANEGFEYL